MALKAMIVDDEPLAVDRLAHLLAQISDLELIGTASDGAQALRLVGELQPDVLLLDIDMPELDGFGVVRALPDRLRERQPLFDRTGGVHAAGLATAEGELLVVREDVGRHNAVDKVTGARVLAGEPTAAAALVVSGRAGFELVQKAIAAGVGSLIAVGAPTSLAVDLARSGDLALYGFTRPGRTVRYC